MIFHVLNGDSLAGKFNLEGEKVICRECLIDGNLKAKNLNQLWQVRAGFFKISYSENSYLEKVKSEFDKLGTIKPTDEVNLWFGNEAFCQLNLWFVISLIWGKGAEIYRIFPDSNDWNCNFENLKSCFESRQKLTEIDLELSFEMWKTYCLQDSKSLKILSQKGSKRFPHLQQVCQALTELDTKPKEILNSIIENGENDFGKIFTQFQQKAGIYGFGDLQVKGILEN